MEGLNFEADSQPRASADHSNTYFPASWSHRAFTEYEG